MDEMKKQILAGVQAHRDEVLRLSRTIWDYAERGMGEHRSAAYYTELLRRLGFAVEENVSGMPTAFIGSWGSGRPVVGFLGEFDALPGLSQKGGSAVRESLGGECGQGCGHNALGAGCLAAALALRDYLERSSLPGTVRFYGCPGEEDGSGKVYMAEDGAFSDLDLCLTWHPSSTTAVMGGGSLAICSLDFEFTGRAAHASSSPYLGRSALDACELTNVGANYLREHVIPEARIHYGYRDAGNPAPNVVQDHAVVNYFCRAPKADQLMPILERLKDVARGAALMTGTTLNIVINDTIANYVPNHTLSAVMQTATEELGVPDYDERDYAQARAFRATFTEAEKNQFRTVLQNAGLPGDYWSADDLLCPRPLPYVKSDKMFGGSTDVGDASFCAPTAFLNGTTVAMGTPGHSWQMTAQGCTPLCDKGTLRAAEIMALTAARAMADPDLLRRAREELLAATGGKPAGLSEKGSHPRLR